MDSLSSPLLPCNLIKSRFCLILFLAPVFAVLPGAAIQNDDAEYAHGADLRHADRPSHFRGKRHPAVRVTEPAR